MSWKKKQTFVFCYAFHKEENQLGDFFSLKSERHLSFLVIVCHILYGSTLTIT